MNKLKKAAAIIGAVAITCCAMAVSSFAADDTYKLYVKADKGSVGDTVTVSVLLDSTETLGVGGLDFKLKYDPAKLELRNEITEGTGQIVGTGDLGLASLGASGTINYAYMDMDLTGSGLTDKNIRVMNLSFKVLQAEGTLTLDEVSVTGKDLTDVIAKTTVITTTAIECSHKHTEVNTQITDCKTGGTKTTVCKDCSAAVKTETVAPADHTVGTWTESKKATCTAKGEETGTCTVCGKSTTRETNMTAHTYGAWAVTTPAGCTDKGVETRTCSVCGNAESRDVKALGHSLGELTTVKEATCTEAGEKAGTCTVCGNKTTEEIPALGHDWGEWEAAEGSAAEKRVCKVCGEEDTRTAAGNIINGVVPVIGVPVVPAVNTDNPAQQETKPADTEAESTNGTTAAPEADSKDNGKGNPTTGVATAVLPAVIAMCAVVIGKKRK